MARIKSALAVLRHPHAENGPGHCHSESQHSSFFWRAPGRLPPLAARLTATATACWSPGCGLASVLVRLAARPGPRRAGPQNGLTATARLQCCRVSKLFI